MKLSIVNSYTLVGIEARPIRIEVHLSNGLPGLSIVGLPEAAVRESKDRVRSAILNAGFDYPARRITVNLAPADLPKYGAGFDLPIAIGILHASDQLKSELLQSTALIGELSLSGELRSIRGVLPIAVKSNKDQKQLLLPYENRNELQILSSNYACAKSLIEVCSHLTGQQKLTQPAIKEKPIEANTICLSDIKGQPQAKRALEIAAAGRHSLMMSGPPGTGKSMLATRLPTILPKLSFDQILEVSSIYSVVQMSRTNVERPPYRSPHHTASPAALVGGGCHFY